MPRKKKIVTEAPAEIQAADIENAAEIENAPADIEKAAPAENAAIPEDIEKAAIPASPTVYVGPSLPALGVIHGTVFAGDPTEAYLAAGEELPEVLAMIVPAGRAASAMRDMERPGSAMHAMRATLLTMQR